MNLLAIKLLLTPFLIGLVTLAGRRWGASVSGWIAGLPLTSGPISLFLALEQGRAFAAHAAVGTLGGLISVALFCLAYAVVARRATWLGSTVAGLAGFFAATVLLKALRLDLLSSFIGGVAVVGLVIALFPKGRKAVASAKAPWWDVPLRMLMATVFVVLLTKMAALLGPQLSGLLSPFPLFVNILAAFAHHQQGAEASILLLRGIVVGSLAFAVFFLVIGALLDRSSVVLTYLAACASALAVNGLSLPWIRQRH